jgi:2-amino-4-hydroxy-6-hydroxymethyldihydropteridine diphosphokinase
MAVREQGLSLGSNLGDRLENLRVARARIARLPDVTVVASSSVYETEPVGVRPEYHDRPFLNAVVVVASAADPRALARELHAIEDAMGRRRSEDRNAPRVIDIDVIYVDNARIDEAELVVPHERWFERRFVVQPLCDLRPNLVIPGQAGTVRDVLLSLSQSSEVVEFATDW